MNKILTCLLIWGTILSHVFAQNDREFWFVAPEVDLSHGDDPIQFRVSAFSQAATVEISMPANPAFPVQSLQVAANQTQTIALTSFKDLVENRPANTPLNKGILITASTPIAAYYEVSHTNNPEIFLLKGKNALGSQFRIPSQNRFNNELGRHAVDIVASQNNTTITITPSQGALGHAKGIPFTIVLNRGETYSLEAVSQGGPYHLGGTLIEADKPIAVTESDDSIRINNGWDLTGDQLVPVEIVGTSYIAIRGEGNAEGVYLTATEDQTQVFRNGNPNPSATIDAGEIHYMPLSQSSMFIETDKPTYVLHLSGIGDEAGSALLPPLNCTGAERIGFIRGPGNVTMILLTRNGNQGSFILNGDPNLIQSNDFFAVPGTNGLWRAARIDATDVLNTTGTNFIQNTSGVFHLGIMNTTGTGSGYGYFSQYNSLYFGGELIMCEGDTLLLDAGDDHDSYAWLDGSDDQFFAVTDSGKYWVTITNQTCTLTDTAQVSVIPANLELGPDTALCQGDSLLLDISRPYGRYTWQDGSTDAQYLIQSAGTYIGTRIEEGCESRDTLSVSYRQRPDWELGPDTTLCDSQRWELDAFFPTGAYTWQDGSSDPTYLVETPGTYWVEMVYQHCPYRDSVINHPALQPMDLGNDTILCPDEQITFDLSFPNTRYRWSDGSSEPTFTIEGPGLYAVEVSNTCLTFSDEIEVSLIDCDCSVHVPSAFSPNGDSHNNLFGALVQCDRLAEFSLQVFDRWGREVFRQETPEQRWDGTDRGIPCQEDVYIWKLHYRGKLDRRSSLIWKQGTVTLIR
ncbi:gliding motility-associated C-terminal domain-containing protein [Pontibacter sp. G13]|uniref:T9SS type B sorting domain-containing protein n=1 Tax=Pontibacter sp. G13 TaxID=3074898 RepID=UPI00288BB140|nr:gliding motility-associated C-terminal domain-containing protein [Pontibacter sp. G13]WNJ21587.1 gliding motility-associated C-terminal domain-containing protein [Pontibacter sp. G13]